MSLVHLLIALYRDRRLAFAAPWIAWLSLCLLTGCIDHSFGRPYSGTRSLLETGGRPPWYCYGGAPTKTSAFVERVGYTTAFTCVAAANAIGETLILPVDLLENPGDELPLPAQPSCGPEPPYPHPPHEREATFATPPPS
jgi:hypothetical protein